MVADTAGPLDGTALTPAAAEEKRDLRSRRLLLLPSIALITVFGILPLFIILI